MINTASNKAMSSSMKMLWIFFLACFLIVQGTLADIICETLPRNLCSFAIASSGKRCVLENFRNEAGKLDFTCKTSEEYVEKLSGYIETDNCVKACGVDRGVVGISSDAFLSPVFTTSLCSPACYNNCPNIVDLYFNLAAGEGVFLPSLCEKQRLSPHRSAMEIMSSGASGSVDDYAVEAPGPVPAPY